MKNQIKKEDIADKIKNYLSPILLKEKGFECCKFHDTNLRIRDLSRKRPMNYDNTVVHYEVFFNDEKQKMFVGIHFLDRIDKSKDLFGKISTNRKFEKHKLKVSESKNGKEKIISLNDECISYSVDYNLIAVNINKKLLLLKEKIEDILNDLNINL